MKDHILIKLDSTTELLQYFTGSVNTTATTKKYASTGIGSGLAVGEKVVIAGFSNADSNGTKTLATVAANEITVEEAIGADETGITATVNQEWQGEWKEVNQFSHLLSVINTSGNAYAYVDQSANGVDTDYTTTITVTAATAKADSIEVLMPYARLRVRTNAADQTTMRAYLFGRRLT
jgi:hypothetical protein